MSVETRKFSRKEPRPSMDVVFYRLLKLQDFPKTPQDLPLKLTLESSLFGNLEKALFLTRNKEIEHGQITYLAPFLGFARTPILSGASGSLPSFTSLLRRHLPRPFLVYHTHPSEGAFPSTDDIRSTQSPLSPYISLIVNSAWATAMVQTEKSQKFNLNLDENQNTFELLGKLEQLENSTDFIYTLPFIAATLEKVGVGFYYHDCSDRASYRKGELLGNLVFKKVRYIGQPHNRF